MLKSGTHIKIYILEDDRWYGAMLEHHLGLNPDYEVKRFESESAFFKALGDAPDVVTLDFSLSEMNGDQVLKKIREISPSTEVVVVSGQEDISTAVRLLKTGAFDYIVKDDDTIDRLWNVLMRLREIKALRSEVEKLKGQLKKQYDFSKSIIGQSDAIRKVFGLIEKATQTNITVTITGETGTGKELVAKAIHFNSARQLQPFVAINVSAIPKDLLESELFGHEKGAFTGAVERRIGKFEEANGGTIFLDEIGELDPLLQSKLLRVLQEREFSRVGGNTLIPVDIRIIVATNRNLLEEVRAKRFREDLYYRLLGLPLELPPLRERGGDILILAKYFAGNFCTENKMAQKSFSPGALQKLKSYHFPGNVRELKSVVELAVVMSDDALVQEDDINLEVNTDTESLLQEETTLRNYELKIISHFLNKYQHDVITVAQKLDVGKSTIYRKIQNGELKL